MVHRMELFVLIELGYPWLNDALQGYIASAYECTIIKHTDELPTENHLLLILCHMQPEKPLVIPTHSRALFSMYPLTDALTRKDCLATVVEYWSAKRPGNVLSSCMPTTVSFEIDYAEYLEEALAESDSYELCRSLSYNTGLVLKDRQWWILKPAMTARGDGIRLFSDEGQLREIFESVEDDEDEVSENVKAVFSNDALASGAVPSSCLRQFIAQRYISNVPCLDNRKFHIRAYVLAVGRLKVYLYQGLLVISASEPYCPPWESMSRGSALTNTHLQGTVCSESARRDFWTLRDDLFGQDGSWKDRAYLRIQQITGECFLAAASMNTNIVLHPDCFEIFALDFLIDQDEHVWLMEVNSGPGLAAEGIGSRIAKGFFQATADVLLKNELGLRPLSGIDEESMKKVLDVALPHQRFAPLKQV
ncbi:tubulin-tyrosine ligase family-domain-containing protein [Fusarium oxysporum f. sp. albedinis]|nr:tubulin-tyrosine ligase family-domain-containing protein [Fusarium oxysporum f. sp. albedinis]